MDGGKQTKLTDQINLSCISCRTFAVDHHYSRSFRAQTLFQRNTEFVAPRSDPSLIQDGEAALGGCTEDDDAVWVERLDVDGLGVARKVCLKLEAAGEEGEVGQGPRHVPFLALPAQASYLRPIREITTLAP